MTRLRQCGVATPGGARCCSTSRSVDAEAARGLLGDLTSVDENFVLGSEMESLPAVFPWETLVHPVLQRPSRQFHKANLALSMPPWHQARCSRLRHVVHGRPLLAHVLHLKERDLDHCWCHAMDSFLEQRPQQQPALCPPSGAPSHSR